MQGATIYGNTVGTKGHGAHCTWYSDFKGTKEKPKVQLKVVTEPTVFNFYQLQLLGSAMLCSLYEIINIPRKSACCWSVAQEILQFGNSEFYLANTYFSRNLISNISNCLILSFTYIHRCYHNKYLLLANMLQLFVITSAYSFIFFCFRIVLIRFTSLSSSEFTRDLQIINVYAIKNNSSQKNLHKRSSESKIIQISFLLR